MDEGGRDDRRHRPWGCRRGRVPRGKGSQHPAVPHRTPWPMAGLPTFTPGPRHPGPGPFPGGFRVCAVRPAGQRGAGAAQGARSSRSPQRRLQAAAGGASESCRHTPGRRGAGGTFLGRGARKVPRGPGTGRGKARRAGESRGRVLGRRGAFPGACRLLPRFHPVNHRPRRRPRREVPGTEGRAGGFPEPQPDCVSARSSGEVAPSPGTPGPSGEGGAAHPAFNRVRPRCSPGSIGVLGAGRTPTPRGPCRRSPGCSLQATPGDQSPVSTLHAGADRVKGQTCLCPAPLPSQCGKS